MTMPPPPGDAVTVALEASRRQVENRLAALRQALQQSPAARLGQKTWTLPLLAAAVGFSVALLLRRGARRSRSLYGGEDDYDRDLD